MSIIMRIISICTFYLLSLMFFGFIVSLYFKNQYPSSLKPLFEFSYKYANYPSNFVRNIYKFTKMELKINSNEKQLNNFYLNNHYKAKNYLFLESVVGDNKINLIDLSNNNVVHSWITPTNINEYTNDKKLTKEIFYGGHLDTNDGSLILRGIETSNTIYKIDKNSELLWLLELESKYHLNEVFHHTLSVDEDGFIYVPIVKFIENFDKLVTNEWREDGYAVISPEGELISEHFLTDIFEDNNLSHYVLGVGAIEWDPYHLNEVEVVKSDSKFWKKGDLLMSLRNLSMILLYRPSTNKITWYQIGPWLSQHDPDFLDDHTLSIFGNDTVSNYFNRGTNEILYYGNNSIYTYDFNTNKTTKMFENLMTESAFNTITGGYHKIIDNDLFVNYDEAGVGILFSEENEIVLSTIDNSNNFLLGARDVFKKNDVKFIKD